MAIAIAVVAILAGTAVPLVLKSVNQAKEQRTRQELKLLYEACFGSLDKGQPGMTGDFGFPTGTGLNLVLTTAASGTRVYGTYAGSPLTGGWRGPYWSGNTTAAGVPRDPWNNAYALSQPGGAGTGYQLSSQGTNGIPVLYPTPVLPLPNGTLTVSVFRLGNYPMPVAGVTVTATTPSRTNVPISVNLPFNSAPSTYQSPINGVTAGPVAITVVVPVQPAVPAQGLAATAAPQTQTRLITLAPGANASLSFTFN